MTTGRVRYDFSLSPLHARAMVTLLALGGVVLGLSGRGRVWFGDTLPVDREAYTSTREFLDPNTAGAASLKRLPRIGPARAQALVQYRQNHGPGAFRTARDLEKVRDIGPGTVRTIAPYLSLPSGL